MSKGSESVKKWREDFKKRDPEGYKKLRRDEYAKWAAKYPEKVKAVSHRTAVRQYGLTPEQYAVMLEQQNGVCKVCGLPPDKERLAVDHNHRTGQVRGLVHKLPCNVMIGYIEKYGHLTEAIKRYLG